jgi:hypothetical protein
VIPTAPLRARNHLAELILAAVRDAGARAVLAELAAETAPPPGWLTEDEGPHAPALLARARAATRALERQPIPMHEPTRDDTLAVAATLFDGGLFFEVHEILEPHWRDASGPAREALQGLIQIAVGYQHLANGNLRGARALLDEGSARLGVGALGGLDLTAFAQAVRASLASPSPVDPPRFPRLGRAA